MARVPLSAVRRYSEALARSAGSAGKDVSKAVLAFAEAYPDASVAQVRAFASSTCLRAVRRNGDACAALACQLFDQIMGAEGVGVEPAEPYDGPDEDAIDRGARYQARKLVDGDLEGFADGMDELARYHTRAAANRTMTRNVERVGARRGVRYARVPTGAETCTYCTMLASRGFVYKSEASAGHADHRGCNCLVVPGVPGRTEVDGYDTRELKERWQAFEEIDARTNEDGSPLTEAEKRRLRWEYLARKQQRDGELVVTNRDAPVYKNVSDSGVALVNRKVRESSSPAKELYLEYEGEFGPAYFDADDGQAYFYPGASRATHFPKGFESLADLAKEEGDTWFHEHGHEVDWLLGGGSGYHSYTWNDHAFSKKIKAEADGWTRSDGRTPPKVFSEMLRRRDKDPGDGEYLRRLWSRYHVIDNDTYFAYKHGEIGIDEVERVMVDADEEKARKALTEILKEMPSERQHAVSDMFEGATNGAVKGYWGHKKNDPGYWTDRGDSGIASEAFAEMFAGEISSTEALGAIREFFPESYNLFRQMIEEVAA